VRLHGAGKHLAKGEASRILHHLVVEDFLVEEVKKSDFYGSVSSVLKVSDSVYFNISVCCNFIPKQIMCSSHCASNVCDIAS
jgi:hypothetical protein